MSDSKVQIYPRCKSDMHCAYVSAEGIVYPCCWLGNFPFNEKYKKFHGEHLDKISLYGNGLEEILTSPQYAKIEESWSREPFETCKSFCGKPPLRKEELLDGTNDILRVYFDAEKK